MRFGFRKPSIRKRIAARTSWKRIARNSLGLKAPRGYGWITNPKKYMYNKVYSRTTRGIGTGNGSGCLVSLILFLGFLAGMGYLAIFMQHNLRF